MARPPLELIGRTLFGHGSLAAYLEEQVGAQVRRQYLLHHGRRFTKLQLRRRFDGAQFGGAVSILPNATVAVTGAAEDGRLVAEHRSRLTGDPAYLDHAPVLDMPERRPVASVDGDELVIAVRFGERDRRFVPALVRAELDLIEAALAVQRGVVARVDTAMSEIVRRLVAEEWPVLTGAQPSRKVVLGPY